MKKPDARIIELAERMISAGQFPGISCSEGHELAEWIFAASEQKEPKYMMTKGTVVSWQVKGAPMRGFGVVIADEEEGYQGYVNVAVETLDGSPNPGYHIVIRCSTTWLTVEHAETQANQSRIITPDWQGFFLNGKAFNQNGPIFGADVRIKLPPECAGYSLAMEAGDSITDTEEIPNQSRVVAIPPCGF